MHGIENMINFKETDTKNVNINMLSGDNMTNQLNKYFSSIWTPASLHLTRMPKTQQLTSVKQRI